MPDIKASESLFTNMVFDRKSEPYRQAMLISRLLLLNYHPDINSGRNHVLALMFDMNLLWEKFVYVSLKKYLKDGKVEQQFSKPYWKLSGKRMVNLRPDVIINKGEKRYVLDTKWKLPGNNKPGHSDLQQMYAYTKYFESSHTILCYPGPEQHLTEGYYCNEIGGKQTYPCSVLRIGLEVGHDQNIVKWQKDISDSLASVCK
jgi:5-methylcytosine-specific restriction enzyme subunit McrC